MKITEIFHTDILVIGSGVAGLTAAWYAGGGKKVSVLLDGAGASPYIHGFCLPVGENDSEELFLKDTLRSGQFEGSTALAEKLISGSRQIPSLLRELDIHLDRTQDGNLAALRPLGASAARVVSAGNHTGAVIGARLRAKLVERRNTYFHMGVRALRILRGEKGIEGVLAYNRSAERFICFSAPVVILASGGFCGIYPFSTNSRDIDGSGIAMAYNADAELCDLEFIQFEPCVAVSPLAVRGKGMITTLFYEGACLRNASGERFLDKTPQKEQLNKDALSAAIYKEIRCGKGTPEGGVWFDATSVGRRRLEEAYPEYLQRYRACDIDLTSQMVQVAPAAHTSLGGVKIDETGKTSVEGLLACGEVTGGIHGANRLGGNAGLETMVFGMTAGKTASELGRKNTLLELKSLHLTVLPEVERCLMRTRMQQELQNNLGVIRSENELRSAVQMFMSLRQQLETATCSEDALAEDGYETLRLQNDLQTATLVAQAALERRQSRGCHILEQAVGPA